MNTPRFRTIRRSIGPKWSIYTALILVGFLVGGGMVTGVYKYVYRASAPNDPEASVLMPSGYIGAPDPAGSGPGSGTAKPGSPAAPAPAANPPVPAPPGDPVAAAKRLVPLADLRRNDRVIYDGTLCQWQQWRNGIDIAVIKCPGRSEFDTQTGRLTPVEVRAG